MNQDYLHYPHRLLDLNKEKTGGIIQNSFNFALELMERIYPERIHELEQAIQTDIPEKIISNAIERGQNFTNELFNYFYNTYLLDDGSYNRRRANAKKYYMKTLNSPSANAMLYHGYFVNQEYLNFLKQTSDIRSLNCEIINVPLFEAIAETVVRICDYTIIKDKYLRYHFEKYVNNSNNHEDKLKIERTLKVKSKRSNAFYFVQVLCRYGSVERQVINNYGVFNPNKETKKYRDSKTSLDSLPPLYHKEFSKWNINFELKIQ